MAKQYISPILKYRLENNQDHNRIYRKLKLRANEVKPNEPKAKLIRQTPIQKITDPIVDTFGDGKNFFKAVKTGKLNDNSLGRINDLGMKAGALLIASFLASRAKTKTDAIMQYIGGATFFASMALWPKIFINLPARLVHGFRIDHRYLSAQGDKKDLGLDNQFQPMDIFTDEEMLKMAKRAGINPKDKHVKEKMQRKMQKTMLQNRTLWMATAGFATPLLTSLTGNFVQPKVANKVIENAFENTRNVLRSPETLSEYMRSAKNIVSNRKEVEEALDALDTALKETSQSTADAYKKLASLLEVSDILEKLKNPDDARPLKGFKSSGVMAILEGMRKELSTVSEKDLRTMLSNTEKLCAENAQSSILVSANNAVQTGGKMLEKADIDAIIKQLNGNYSLRNIEKVLSTQSSSMVSEVNIKKLMTSLSSRADNKEFIQTVKEYNETVLGALRGRLKAYLRLVNSIAGQKSESVYTKEYMDTMKELFSALDIKDDELKQIAKGKDSDVIELLVKKMQAKVKKGDDGYIELFNPRPATGKLPNEIAKKRIEAMPDGIKKTLYSLKLKAGEFIEKYLKPACDKVKPTSLSMTKNEQLNDVLLPHLENINKAKAKLRALFGESYARIKENSGNDDINNLLTYITKGNDVWINEIIDEYCKQTKTSVNKEQLKASFLEIIDSIESSRDSVIEKLQNILKRSGDDIRTNLRYTVYPNGKKGIEELVGKATPIDFAYSTRRAGVESLVDTLQDRSTMQSITDVDDKLKPLTDAIFGGNDKNSAYGILSKFINLQRVNLSAIKAKAIIFANFERRLKDGEFEDLFGTIENPKNANLLLAARKMLIDGNINQWKNAFSMHGNENKKMFEILAERVFDSAAFAKEEQSCKGISAIVDGLKDMVKAGSAAQAEQYLKTGSLLGLVKSQAKMMYENKSWKKIFVPMTLALIGITLLVQPLFGKIKKEFPEDKGNGGRK